ncbi:MAG: T9SS type A sorting domain-containing protein [Parabacteroides sp.]|nr:T9SS type A sorting domain-containing protein [Parabacteroides sp.]
MCQGDDVVDPPYFSSASIARIGNHIGSNDYLQKIAITSGPSVMARNATVTYTTSTAIPSVLNWATPGMELLSTSGTNTTFKALRDGSSYVRLYKVGGASIEKEVHIGTPVPEITGEHRVFNNQYATFRASCSPLANATNYQWVLNPVNGNTVYGANTQVLDVAFYNTGSYQVLARASNSYGVGEYTSFGLSVINSSSYSSMVYPSPASQTLYVDFSSIDDQAQALSATAKQLKNYDIRLFNTQGSLVRTAQSAGERISLDVSGLPNGNYFLHIYDGKGEKPVVQQIVVSH